MIRQANPLAPGSFNRESDDDPTPNASSIPASRGVKYQGFVCLVYEGWKDREAMHAVPRGVKFLRNQLTP